MLAYSDSPAGLGIDLATGWMRNRTSPPGSYRVSASKDWASGRCRYWEAHRRGRHPWCVLSMAAARLRQFSNFEGIPRLGSSRYRRWRPIHA